MRAPRRGSGLSDAATATLESVLTACTVVLLLASLGGLAALISGLHVGLRVGDIVVFRPAAGLASSTPVTAAYANAGLLPDGSKVVCTLDPAVMARYGGSLTVERKSLAKPIYGVHWAGGQTSSDTSSCGRAADLTLSRMDLQSLVTAVGGFTFDSRGNVL